MKRKILIMGLPGSGKTTLAELLVRVLMPYGLTQMRFAAKLVVI